MNKELQYKQLELELDPVKSVLNFATDTILDQDVSRYPIFVIHQQEINLGIPLEIDSALSRWKANASSLEEFVTKQLIESEKVDDFKRVYKDPQEFLCLFLIEETGANFVFIPRN